MKINNIKYTLLILSFGFAMINAADEPAEYNFKIETRGIIGIDQGVNKFDIDISTNADVNQLKEEISQRIGVPKDDFLLVSPRIRGGALKKEEQLSSYIGNLLGPIEIWIVAKNDPITLRFFGLPFNEPNTLLQY